MSTTQHIRNKSEIRNLAEFYLKQGKLRDYLLIIMGVHTALRIGDLLKIKWDDVYDFGSKRIRESVSILEQKTHKTKIVKINKAAHIAINTCITNAKEGEYLFSSRKGGAIGRVQAYRIIRSASEELKFDSIVSCHSLRKTFGYHAWKSGILPAVLMEIYNHSNFAVTRRYLGVSQDDKDEVYNLIGEFL